MAPVEAPPPPIAERNWLSPIPGQLWFPSPPPAVPGVDYQLVYAMYAYECLVARVRWHLGHPQYPVPPHTHPVAHRLPGGHKPRHRAERELARREMTREHCRRVVFTFWPPLSVMAALLATLSPSLEEQNDDQRADEHRAVGEPHPDNDPGSPPRDDEA